jgi:hypothetical protein
MGSDTDKQVFLGIAEYLKSRGELPQGDLVAFSGPELCSWASRHLGIPDEQTKGGSRTSGGKTVYSSESGCLVGGLAHHQ